MLIMQTIKTTIIPTKEEIERVKQLHDKYMEKLDKIVYIDVLKKREKRKC